MQNSKTVSIIIEAVLIVGYLLLGIGFFITNRHCMADLPLFIAGGVLTAGCAVTLILHEVKYK